MTSNEERRLEALKRLGVIGTDQGDIFDIYSELALEVSGFFAATCSLIDVDTQHGISLCSLNGELEKMTEGKPVKVERAQSPCAYTILTPEPLLVPDCREHEIFKDAGAVKAGMIVAYAGFPIINKDNYVFGTICLFDPNIKKLEKQEIKLLEKLTKRLAHQLDTQAEQKAITAEKISLAISSATSSGSYSLVGGGDTLAAIKNTDYQKLFTHLSTAGGAFLESLEGKQLPGVKVLTN